MARRFNYNKRNEKWGTNLVSTLIAWAIVAPFALGGATSKFHSNYDDEPVSKTMAIILIIIGIVLIPFFVPFIRCIDGTIFSIFIGLPIAIWITIIWKVIEAFAAKKSDIKTYKKEKKSSPQPKSKQLGAEEIKEIERRKLQEERCAILRAEIEKEKEEERKQNLARFQYQYSESREEIRRQIRRDIGNNFIKQESKPKSKQLSAEEIKEFERRRLQEERCAILRAEIEKEKEEKRRQNLERFQHLHNEKREEIRRKIQRDIEEDRKCKNQERMQYANKRCK